MKNQIRIFYFIIVSLFTTTGYSQIDIMTIGFGDIVTQSGSQFTVPVSKNSISCQYDCFFNTGGASAIQIHLEFDSSVIEFVDINSSQISLSTANVIQHKPGVISIVWIQQDYSEILDVESVLFNLIFNAIGADGTSTSINDYTDLKSTWSRNANDGKGGNEINFWPPNSINITGTLGGKDVNVKSKKIFPNPTSEFIDISNYQVTEDYEIYNATGQKILNGSLEASGRVNVQNLQSGTYFLKLESGSTFKFIKE